MSILFFIYFAVDKNVKNQGNSFLIYNYIVLIVMI